MRLFVSVCRCVCTCVCMSEEVGSMHVIPMVCIEEHSGLLEF